MLTVKKGDVLINIYRTKEGKPFDELFMGRICSSRVLTFEGHIHALVDKHIYFMCEENFWKTECESINKKYYEPLSGGDDNSAYILIDSQEGIDIWESIETYIESNESDKLNELIYSLLDGCYENGNLIL